MSKIVRLIAAGIMIWIGAVSLANAASLVKRAAGHSDGPAARRVIALAQRGDARAQATLGFMYANGRGVPQSYDVAVDWYLLSAEQGDPTGQYLLGIRLHPECHSRPYVAQSRSRAYAAVESRECVAAARSRRGQNDTSTT